MPDQEIASVTGINSGVQFVGGGTNSGGKHIYAGARTAEGSSQSIQIKRVRKVPLTVEWINGLASALAVLTFVTGWRGYDLVRSSDRLSDVFSASGWFDVPRLVWMAVAFVVFAASAATVYCLGRFLRRHVMCFPRWSALPVFVGGRGPDGRTRPLLVRLTARCRECGGRMRFYDMPIAWIDWRHADGRRTREITSRRPHAVCTQNSDHRAEVDIAKSDFGEPIW
ncbi:MAG: hypothetical protein IE923_13455 [Micrococcales bacterium]|nr:hypothetical protein [Micrococcales bacterium]